MTVFYFFRHTLVFEVFNAQSLTIFNIVYEKGAAPSGVSGLDTNGGKASVFSRGSLLALYIYFCIYISSFSFQLYIIIYVLLWFRFVAGVSGLHTNGSNPSAFQKVG